MCVCSGVLQGATPLASTVKSSVQDRRTLDWAKLEDPCASKQLRAECRCVETSTGTGALPSLSLKCARSMLPTIMMSEDPPSFVALRREAKRSENSCPRRGSVLALNSEFLREAAA